MPAPVRVDPMTVEVESIRKEFPGHLALDDINLQVPAGSFTTLLGPSGCGKTTLLRILAGFETPTSGTVRFGERDVSRIQPWKRDVGFVFQNYALWPSMTIAQTIAYGLKIRKLSKQAIADRVQSSLEMVGLANRADAFPGQLSGGQQQRVSIARALALQPTVLLLDEPLSNLDAKMRIDMRQELLTLQREIGITAVYVTHDQEEALEMSDHVAVLHDGRIEQFGSPEDIYERPATSYVASFVGQVTLIAGSNDDSMFRATAHGATPVEVPGASHTGAGSLAVRPEHFTIGQPGTGVADASYVRTSYLGRGRMSIFTLDDGTRAHVSHSDELGLNVGERVALRAERGAVVPREESPSAEQPRPHVRIHQSENTISV